MKTWIGYGLAALVFLGAVLTYTVSRFASPVATVPVATTTPETATTTSASQTPVPVPSLYPFALAKGDTVASWRFSSVATGNAVATQRAVDEIVRLNTLLAASKNDAYELYISIANQYLALGDGEQALLYLRKALAIDSQKTGLAWNNLGFLLEQVKAFHTARRAYENAVQAQPIAQYKATLEDFLAHHPGI